MFCVFGLCELQTEVCHLSGAGGRRRWEGWARRPSAADQSSGYGRCPAWCRVACTPPSQPLKEHPKWSLSWSAIFTATKRYELTVVQLALPPLYHETLLCDLQSPPVCFVWACFELKLVFHIVAYQYAPSFTIDYSGRMWYFCSHGRPAHHSPFTSP